MMGEQSYCVLLLHRARPGCSRRVLQRYFATEHAAILRRSRDALGYQQYVQQHASPDVGLGEVISAGRSWVPVATAAVASCKDIPEPHWACLDGDASHDVTEAFHYGSRDALLEALRHEGSKSELALAVEARQPWVDRTLALVGNAYQVAEDSAPYPRVRLTFCLVRRHGMARKDMQRYWREHHGPFVRTLEPKLEYAGYTQVHADSAEVADSVALAFGADSCSTYDGTASLIYPSEPALRRTFTTLACQQANMALTKDELNFVDAQRSHLIYGEEVLIA